MTLRPRHSTIVAATKRRPTSLSHFGLQQARRPSKETRTLRSRTQQGMFSAPAVPGPSGKRAGALVMSEPPPRSRQPQATPHMGFLLYALDEGGLAREAMRAAAPRVAECFTGQEVAHLSHQGRATPIKATSVKFTSIAESTALHRKHACGSRNQDPYLGIQGRLSWSS